MYKRRGEYNKPYKRYQTLAIRVCSFWGLLDYPQHPTVSVQKENMVDQGTEIEEISIKRKDEHHGTGIHSLGYRSLSFEKVYVLVFELYSLFYVAQNSIVFLPRR
jgi:hypothetical protein